MIEDILEYYEVEIARELGSGEVLCFCPFHTGDSGDPKLQVNIISDIFHCWSCGAKGNYIDFIKLKENITEYRDALVFLNKITSNSNYDVAILKNKFDRLGQKKEKFVERDFKKARFAYLSKIGDLKIELYDLFKEKTKFYFEILKSIEKKTILNNTEDIERYINYYNPEVDFCLQYIDYTVGRLDEIFLVCQTNEKLHSFYNYACKEIEWLKKMIRQRVR